MKRLGRYAFNTLTLLSLLLCAATLTLWVQSYRRTDGIVAGYWRYRYHPGYPKYFDAWEVDASNSRGQWMARGWLRQCVAGPGRYEDRSGRQAANRREERLALIGPTMRNVIRDDFEVERAAHSWFLAERVNRRRHDEPAVGFGVKHRGRA